MVRKLGVPGHEEYAMGAIASGGEQVLDTELVRELGIGAEAQGAIFVTNPGRAFAFAEAS